MSWAEERVSGGGGGKEDAFSPRLVLVAYTRVFYARVL